MTCILNSQQISAFVTIIYFCQARLVAFFNHHCTTALFFFFFFLNLNVSYSAGFFST